MSVLTERAIKEAFLALLARRPLDTITVKDIAAECGINRNTFYYHYQDIPSLLETIIREDCDRIIGQYPDLDSLEDCLRLAVEFAESERTIILHCFRSDHRASVEHYLWQLCSYAVTTYAEKVLAPYAVSEADKRIILRHYQCVCFGHVMAWLEDGMREDIGPLLVRLCQLKEGQLEEMIRRCDESAKHNAARESLLP